MARITRNKAAEILGVSRQTISNYIKEGILGSYVGEHGILYVNSEDIEKYAQKYKMIAANEKMIDEKLKEAEKESDTAIHQIAEKNRTIRFYVLLGILWRKRWACEHAKVNYCKHRITLGQLIDVMNHSDKMCDKISNKISELTKELNELDK